MALLHVLPQRLDVVPGTSHLHQPMEVIVNTTRVRLVDLDHRQKVLVRHEDLVLVVEDAREEHPPLEILLELAGHGKSRRQSYRRLLLVVASLQRGCFLAVFAATGVGEEVVQLAQFAGESG